MSSLNGTAKQSPAPGDANITVHGVVASFARWMRQRGVRFTLSTNEGGALTITIPALTLEIVEGGSGKITPETRTVKASPQTPDAAQGGE